MGKELVISADRHESRVAVLEDDQLVEIYFQRANEYSLAGSIHKGRVTRVLPGMQSAFVDIGLERDAFLYVSDFFEEHEEYDKMPGGEERGRRAEPAAAVAEKPEAASERGTEGDQHDRRGRRSRRRRNRGRGFPESKYAAEPAPAWKPAEPPRGDFAVLPGESLAKYSHPDEEASTEEATPAAAGEEAAATATEEQAVATVAEGEPAGAEPEFVPPADLERTAAAAEEPEEVAVPAEVQAAVEELEAALEAEEAEPAGEISLAESPAGDAAESPAEEPVAAESAPQGDAAGPALASAAELRESGRLYTHRISRRLRRKTRYPEGRAESEEAAPAPRPEVEEAARPEKPEPSISDLLKEGQEILVQIAKEPLGQKGARITSHIALPGRYVVYMPTVEHLGVSRKIGSDEERMRLRRILQAHRAGMPGGFIIRTAGGGRSEQEIAADMKYLYNLWLDIRQKAERRPAPLLVYHDLDVVQRLLRDQLTDNFKAIWVDNEEVYESVLRYVERLQPSLMSRVKLYTRPTPIFDAFNITSELEKALRPKVWLKSGGYIVVNQTEALVAIDINTGKFVGKTSTRLEDTIFKTNTEAIKEIVRQVRLRDLGGIIVIDFIDMEERKNRQKVMQTLEEEMRNDRAPYKILSFNDFGLVAITRKRVKQSLERTLCAPCPTCESAGYVKSVQTVIGEILQEARKLAGVVEGPQVSLRVHPDVAKVLKSTRNDYLEELEEILKRPVLVTGDGLLHPEKFDLA